MRSPAPLLLALLGTIPGSTASAQVDLSLDGYARVLAEHVNGRGEVGYAELKADIGPLDDFLRSIAILPRADYDSWDEPAQVAFWVNAYNAITLKVIVDHYPIRASGFRSLVYPGNSIRQIRGAWDRLSFPVMGAPLTLDEIEHEILRERFDRPGIHLALVCGARGCPWLRQEPYEGEILDEQLRDQGRLLVMRDDSFRIDRRRDRVHLSSVFKWFGDDFVDRFAPDVGFEGHRPAERAVLRFLAGFLGAEDAAYLRDGKYRVRYLKYDWSLNEPGGGR